MHFGFRAVGEKWHSNEHPEETVTFFFWTEYVLVTIRCQEGEAPSPMRPGKGVSNLFRDAVGHGTVQLPVVST